MPYLTVVICSYNRAESLRQTLASLACATRPAAKEIEVLVIANACTDNTLAMLNIMGKDGLGSGLTLRWNVEPTPGKSNALNCAVRETATDTLCFIDDDQLVDTSFLVGLTDTLEHYPDADIICGKIAPAWDGSEPKWVHAKGRYHIPIRPFPEYDYGNKPLYLNNNMRLPSGGNITVRRRIFDKVGGFLEELGPQGHNLMGGEDNEFLQRAVSAGARILYAPSISQLHMVDNERMTTFYMMRKSYLRSLSHVLITKDGPVTLRPYMFAKPIKYAFSALFTFNSCRRFHFLMRLAASLGEMRAAISLGK